MLLEWMTKKNIIENQAEFLNSMIGYKENDLKSIKEDVWNDLYIKYWKLVPSRSYINKIINEFIF